MMRSVRTQLILSALGASLLAAACGDDSEGSSRTGASAGAEATGGSGVAAAGGTSTAAGGTGDGGAANAGSSGQTFGSGGADATGGQSPTGGSAGSSSGGAAGTSGGSSNTGGSSGVEATGGDAGAAGETVATGGSSGGDATGGNSGSDATGGAAGTGGSSSGCSTNGPGSSIPVGPYIMIDQFGYLPDMAKVAVLVDPQEGFNAADSFSPGNSYELRRWEDTTAVYSAAPTSWNGGQTQASSGDRGWWFDFSSVTESGSYFVYDSENDLRSHCFDIDDNVYRAPLVAATRMYFYNRCGFAKQEPYTDARWTDAAAYVGAGQDTEARFVDDKENASLERDMSGGWFDAGDTNKYTTFAHKPVHQLLTAYSHNPAAFTDDFNLPESGNGLPDVLDEVIWELDWLIKMQNDDGSAHIKVGLVDGDDASPPSIDTAARYYAPVCSSATIAVSSMFAHAALVLGDFASLSSYASELETRAIQAWDWYQTNPQQTDCDSQEIQAGDADWDTDKQHRTAVVAAIYLFALTGQNEYHTQVINNYDITWPYQDNAWSRYEAPEGDALLFYATLPNADTTVANAIVNKKVDEATTYDDIYRFDPDLDLYRAYITDWTYHWGSHQPRCDNGNTNVDMLEYALDATNQSGYYERASGILNYIHGVNPFGMVYLSNMYDYGAEVSANEIYHVWFSDGTDWDNALTSLYGPAPGYLPGGPNADYSGDAAPPAGQPRQKSYLDWNGVAWSDTFRDLSWEITEPGIYYQSAYVKLASSFVGR